MEAFFDGAAKYWSILSFIALILLIPVWDWVVLASMKRIHTRGQLKPFIEMLFAPELRHSDELGRIVETLRDKFTLFETTFALYLESQTKAENRLAAALEEMTGLVREQTKQINSTREDVAELRGQWDGQERRKAQERSSREGG